MHHAVPLVSLRLPADAGGGPHPVGPVDPVPPPESGCAGPAGSQRVRRQILRIDDCAVWTSLSPAGDTLTVGIFNLGDVQQAVSIPQDLLEIPSMPIGRDLWTGKFYATPYDTIPALLNPHACELIAFPLDQ